MRSGWLCGCVGLSAVLGCLPVRAGVLDRPYQEPKPWEESSHPLPAFPLDSDLVQVFRGLGSPPFGVSLDMRSLSVSDDGVAHYTVVLVSGSGARNVLHEGIRCATRDYKTYAIGSPEGAFQPLPDSGWHRIARNGSVAYRYALAREYLCGTYLNSLPLKDIKRRLRQAASSRPGSDY